MYFSVLLTPTGMPSPAFAFDVWVTQHESILSMTSILEQVRRSDGSRVCVVLPEDSPLVTECIEQPDCEELLTLHTIETPKSFHATRSPHVFHKYRTSENLYLDLLAHVAEFGEERTDRTGVGTRSLFGPQIVFDLTEGFPLLTTKKLNFQHILHEVLWYLSGDTHTGYLQRHRVNVWNGNTSREFLDQRGLHEYNVGETGPLYGFQWRHFGGDFRQVDSSPGVDQLARILSILRTDPTSRRMFLSAWNPTDLDKMCLEPCHVSFQVYVRKGEFLDGKLYMRSNDLFLGAPWNIAAYSILIHMFAHLSGYRPGRLVYSLGDSHVYLNHLEQVQQQLSRPLRPLPRLSIRDESKSIKNWEDFRIDHFHLEHYAPHPAIRAQMAI